MPDFSYTDLLPLGPDTTEYRLVSEAGVAPRSAFDREFLEVEPQALTLLTAQAMHDIAHLLRPGAPAPAAVDPRRPRGLPERPVRRQ